MSKVKTTEKERTASNELRALRREYRELDGANRRGNNALRALLLLCKQMSMAASSLSESEPCHHLIRSWAQQADEALR
jgi:hypothetical protein